MDEMRMCNTCGETKQLIKFPISNKDLGTRRFKCTKCTESKKVVDSEIVPVMENQIEIIVPTPINIENNKKIEQEIIIPINKEKSKKINCTYSLHESTIRKLDELKYKWMPARTKLNDIVEAAINEYYNKTIKQ